MFAMLWHISLVGQNNKLAQQYYSNGEFRKAGVLFKQLYEKNNRNNYYFDRYMSCLLAVKDYNLAEKEIKQQIKRRSKDAHLLVIHGKIYEQQYDQITADKLYEKAIAKLTADRIQVIKLASAFNNLNHYELAIRSFEKGMDLLGDERMFAYNIADLFRKEGDKPKMIYYYLLSLDQTKNRVQNVKNIFARYLDDEDFKELQRQLYKNIQKYPEAIIYPEFLEWSLIQKGDFKGALRQDMALDRRLEENGQRVFNLAKMASNAKDYETALNAYRYIITEKGQNSSFYIIAQEKSLENKRKMVLSNKNYSVVDLENLRDEYRQFIDQLGWNSRTSSLIYELAQLTAYYLDDKTYAISVLLRLVEFQGGNKHINAEAKLMLGDLYLIDGEIWEATLLYSQVDKEFREDHLGEMARYKNAKLAYFNGDFEWAQAQFDILKAATSRLISNDAIDLSVFIMDNMGLDTTAVPLEMFAAAELLIFQNKLLEARELMQTIRNRFPKHDLEDDILYAMAQVHLKQKEYNEAIELFTKIVELFPDEIRADNAMYDMAVIYDEIFEDIEKAMSIYERIFIEYSNSTFAIESRNRFRELRGDNL